LDNILVVHGPSYAYAIEGLGKITTSINKFFGAPETFKLVLFTGGEDVDPSLYGETSPKGMCGFNTMRDYREMEIFRLATENGVPMAGICRGIQFLNVMAGGRMFHHVTNHAGTIHTMKTVIGEVIQINSLHHQMVRPPEDAHIIGWAEDNLSSIYVADKDIPIDYDGPEVEAVIFPNTLSFGVQYHPEMIPATERAHGFFWEMVAMVIDRGWEGFLEHYTIGGEIDDTSVAQRDGYTSG